ncbi:LamG-like jellyroll fold domain-containing protein [Microbispora triticiradicis]|nr:LamG-like jellyroll fold domain-containing protein [Microbispora triticiradicis]
MRLHRAMPAFVLIAAALSPLTPGSRAYAEPVPAAQQDEAAALRAARTSGQPVEVLDRRTENRTVYANSDGTFTLEQSPLPVRVRRGAGWAAVDTTLRAEPDGTIAPVATAVGLSLSGGGDGPFATISDQGRELSMSWPGKLPAPEIEGASATYPEVLPGVDLRVTASVTGFSEVLVVKDAQAAANPALATITFGLGTKGVAVSEGAEGAAQAVAEGGAVVFHSPTPQMWDSSAAGATAGRQASSADAPESGSRRATMPTEVTSSAISITPDRAMLTDSGTTFPVFIDPEWTGSRLGWAMVSSDGSYTGWNPSHRSEAGSYNGSVKRRSFYRMRTDHVAYKHILKATFRITETWSWSCSARPVQLWFTGPISQSTTWAKQPALHRKLDELNVAKGYSPGGCDSGGIEFDATDAVVSTAGRGLDDTTLGLIAGDETDNYGWKGFDQDTAKLVVTYNSVPSRPAAMGTAPATPCATGSGRPAVNSLTPALKAKIYDPDKAGDGVRAEFDVNVHNPSAGTWGDLYTKTTGYKASVDPVEHKVTLSGLVEGGVYSWRVRAYDGTDGGPWSAWCEFRVDTAVPAGLPGVSSARYPGDEPTDPSLWHDGIGRPGAFTFTRNAADPDVVAFDYAVDDITARRRVQASSGAATVQIAPSHDWLNTVYVWPVDQAGNLGPYAAYQFYVSFTAAGPVSHWTMDEAAASATAADAVGGKTLTATDVSFGGGRSVKAAYLNGTGSHLATSGPVLDTGKAFTVSAWAQVTNDTHVNTVAAQEGNRAAGFQLYYNHGDKKWNFGRRPSDADGVSPVKAVSDAPARLNAWEHLVGVYDPAAAQLRLYVNGRLQSSQPAFTTPWNATGAFEIGRMKIDGVLGNYFGGVVDEVRVWDRIVYPSEVADLVNRPPQHQGRWRFDEGSGTSAATSTSHTGRAATLSGGAAWTTDGHDLNALALPGSGQYAATPAYVTRTDGSFTAVAWVRLTGAGRTATAVSQDGARRSAFTLGYRVFGTTGKWSFDLPDADTDTASLFSAAADPALAPVDPEQWTLLTGVYDYPRQEQRLYVNGQKVAVTAFGSPWNSTGALQMGRARSAGAATGYWPGDLDDVHVYTGVLTDEEILGLALGLA